MDPNNLKLSVAAYFGEVRLRSLHSKMPSTVVSTTQDSYGNTIYQVRLSPITCDRVLHQAECLGVLGTQLFFIMMGVPSLKMGVPSFCNIKFIKEDTQD